MKSKVIRCSYCMKNLERHNWQIKKFKNHFCNLNCKAKWQEKNLCGENNPFYNKKHNEKTKIWISKYRIKNGIAKGKNNPRFNVKLSEETKRKISQKAKERFANGFKIIMPHRNTSIERKIQDYLKLLGIEFFTHQRIDIEHKFECDILIPSMNMVIECDGDRWHKYPIGTNADKIRTKELLEKGFKVLRLWECEIKQMNLETFKEKLLPKDYLGRFTKNG